VWFLPPKISVLMMTYNHAALIRKAVDSALMQEGPFRLQLVIGDDCSRDGAADILADYAQKHPNVIKYLLGEKNIGPNLNFLRIYHECDGDYLALLEGDDYWLTRDKLAKQLAFLSEHPEYAGCGHRVYHVDDREQVLGVFPATNETRHDFAALARRNPFGTCSLLYRRTIAELPEWMKVVPCGDWPLHLLHARHGPLGMLPDILGAYRIHANGAWSALTAVNKLQKTLTMFEHVIGDFTGAEREALVQSQRAHGLDLAYALSEVGQRSEAKDRFQRVCNQPGAKALPWTQRMIVWLGVYLGPVYWPIRKALRRFF
jgi:glycosyltransferase involved in cell wall biosynthesis